MHLYSKPSKASSYQSINYASILQTVKSKFLSINYPVEKFRIGLWKRRDAGRVDASAPPGTGGADAPGQDQYRETLLIISFMISVVPPPMLRMRESR